MLNLPDPLLRLIQRDRRYKVDAYFFIDSALQYARDRLGMGRDETSLQEEPPEPQPEDPPTTERHITGQELCEAIRILALKEYGYMAKSVFNSWGVHGTRDFGNIVFNLIEIGSCKKTERDRIEDFDNVFDFDVALRQNFSIGPSESKHG